jgi:hypothetical protein
MIFSSDPKDSATFSLDPLSVVIDRQKMFSSFFSCKTYFHTMCGKLAAILLAQKPLLSTDLFPEGSSTAITITSGKIHVDHILVILNRKVKIAVCFQFFLFNTLSHIRK